MAQKPSFTFLAGGDVALNRKSPRRAFGSLTPLLQRADVAFANLESPLSRLGEPATGKYVIRGKPEMAAAFTEAGFDLLAFANNHALDYGEEAFFDTLSLMQRLSIPLVGAGADLGAARKPVIMERNGLRVGALAYCSVLPRNYAAGTELTFGKNVPPKIYTPAGVNPLRASTAYLPPEGIEESPGRAAEILTWAHPENLQRMRKDIQRLRARVDAVIVNHHWGTSMVHRVHDFQREIAHAAVDAGADVVLGGHPHVIQGIEFYRGKPIVYSMGNLIFDYEIFFFTDATRQTMLFGCTVGKAGVSDCYALPCRSGKFNAPLPLSPLRGEGREIFDLVSRLSKPWGTQMRAEKDRIAIITSRGE